MTEEQEPKVSRKEQILQSLAKMLEQSPGARITTAGLARQVGVSEAALYRHFPSKAKMFEALIEFIEDTIFSRVSIILTEENSTEARCNQVLTLLLTFSERNPGITRILTGDPLSGESERLRMRVSQFFERLETQLRQILREAEIRNNHQTSLDINMAANLMLSTVEGKICQYVRSDFETVPTLHWQSQWQVLKQVVFARI
ncbi:MAG: nucleoid occlusion factor SlmA [Gammaproteobacteria bacterium]|jgi:TetR/AcrR family transcriptional regulator|nr:nucleoid occlusion factor SlmA [Gammaproteobacteria bacterium]|tara:strand:+ start:15765 stop:16367 length:603 start_codon:yes stop_codon:yes gene_type:complete